MRGLFARSLYKLSLRSLLRNPAQSKGTWAFHNSHFVGKFTGAAPDATPATSVLCELAHSKDTCTFRKSYFVEIYRNRAVRQSATPVLCEPAQMHTDISQEPFCEAARQSRDTRFARACAVEMHMDISQEPLCREIYRANAKC